MAQTLPPIKQKLAENGLLNIISWADVSRNYFGKSNSWLYHKLRGIDGNGKETSFTDEERQILRDALCDLSKKLESAASLI